MARGNERNMKDVLCIIVIGLLISVSCRAQEDSYLKLLKEGVLQVRNAKASSNVLNKTVMDWSGVNRPKITLMDEIERDTKHEFRGNGANKFKMNQVVTYVYSRQNTGMVSKGDYFNSTEKDVLYSVIEKNVKSKQTATYTLTGHLGMQEFVFVSYNPKTNFSATVNGKSATEKEKGVQTIRIDHVKKSDTITFSITNNSGYDESFVILNHNPQK